MRVASLFAGIGGIDLAAELLGARVVRQAECCPYARAVLQDRFAEVELVDDARYARLDDVDVVVAGFPCQGVSAAASTRTAHGILDPASPSAVVVGVLERITRAHPRYVLLENAAALSTRRFTSDLDAISRALTGAGYNVCVTTINAGCYGLPHRRLRTFVLATLDARQDRQFSSRVEYTVSGPDTMLGVNGMHGGATWCAQPSVTRKAGSYTLAVARDGLFSLTPEGVEALLGLPHGWTRAARTATARYALLGNAVAVPAAQAALCALLDLPEPTPRPTPYTTLRPWLRPASGRTAGSMLRRIARTWHGGRGRPNTNQIELDYAVPVYLRALERDHESTTPAMLQAAEVVAREHAKSPAPTWPACVRVAFSQSAALRWVASSTTRRNRRGGHT